MEDVKIFLKPIDVDKFKLFLQHYDFFDVLITNNVQNLRNGSAELHFNEQGILSSVTKHQMTYRRSKI